MIKHHIFCANCDIDMQLSIKDDIRDALEIPIDKRPEYCPFCSSEDLETYQADRGDKDGIIFTLSISTLIKEFNSTNARFIEATEGKIPAGLKAYQDKKAGKEEKKECDGHSMQRTRPDHN